MGIEILLRMFQVQNAILFTVVFKHYLFELD